MNKSKTYDISVIIPFKDKSKMTIVCIDSFIRFGPPVKQILLVSNNSTKEQLDEIKNHIKDIANIDLIEYNKPFNYQKLNNWAVSKSTGESILFLNNDTELVAQSKGLIERMFKKAAMPNVGITGCLLLYGDGSTIQHAGVYLLPRGTADHLYVGKKLKVVMKHNKSSQFPYDISEDRPMTAVTGAVNLIQRRKFIKVGGFDERFIIGGGDVDLCIRLNKAEYQTWYISGGYIIHKESQSRAHTPITYNDFYYSYLSYIQGYDIKKGDPYLPLITQGMSE